jgi:cytochrome c oxidase cbb3-type subunit 3
VHAQADDEQTLEPSVLSASPYSIHADEALHAFVQERAQAAIATHCARCHGEDLEGRPGVPNLVDYDWLWGITFQETNDVAPVMEIEQTILYGVRNTDCPDIEDVSYYGACADTRFSQMPAYGELGAFDDAQLDDVTEYVLTLSGRGTDDGAAARGEALWPVCIECHGPDGAGYKPYGGPDLTDDVWLFGDDRATIRDVIANGRTEVCPAWSKTLDLTTIKSLAVYIWGKANGQYDDEAADDLEGLFDFSP